MPEKFNREISDAIISEDMDAVERLLERIPPESINSDIEIYDANNNLVTTIRPLSFALENHLLDAAEFLIENGADIAGIPFPGIGMVSEMPEKLNLEISDAIRSKDIGAIARVLETIPLEHVNSYIKIYDANNKLMSFRRPLHYAAVHSLFETAKLLIENGATIKEEPLDDIYELFLFAIFARNVDMIRLLLEKGANPNPPLTDESEIPYMNPLGHAISCLNSTNLELEIVKSFEIVKLLIANGANVNYTSEDLLGHSMLESAAMGGNLELVKLLVANGADLNATSIRYGTTPIMLATEYGHLPVIKFLVMNGAKVNIKSEIWDTILARAKKDNHNDCVDYIKNDVKKIMLMLTMKQGQLPGPDNKSSLNILPDDIMRSVDAMLHEKKPTKPQKPT